MMQKTRRNHVRRVIDICMTVLLICLMSYQVTGEEKHEWTGIIMTLFVIAHQILNRRWYAALFKGKYNAYRTVTTVTNTLLFAALFVTAFCGMAMSEYAVPFFYFTRGVYIVRPTHLAMTHWAFILMGLHLGLQVPVMLGKYKPEENRKIVIAVVFSLIGGLGLWLFLKNGMPNYLFFRVPFAFLDYEKPMWLVFLEHALMLSFWAFAGAEVALICLRKKNASGKSLLLPICFVAVSVLLGCTLHSFFPGDSNSGFDSSDWSTVPETLSAQNESIPVEAQESTSLKDVDDGLIMTMT